MKSYSKSQQEDYPPSCVRTVKVQAARKVIVVLAGLITVSALPWGCAGRPTVSAKEPSADDRAAPNGQPQADQPEIPMSDLSESAIAPPRPGQVVTNSIGMKMAWIPPGEFLMGSPAEEQGRGIGEGPQHQVVLTKGFYIGVYEVTQRQWQAVMGSSPSRHGVTHLLWRSVMQSSPGSISNRFKGDELPVEGVHWAAAVIFCRRLSAKEGLEYRLPTEAEWEYACRAGSQKRYSFGDSDSSLGDYAWYNENSNNKTHMVGQKKPNAWGLYDMHGNVCEWCQEAYGAHNIGRGGSWDDPARNCRSAKRNRFTPSYRKINTLGFRIVRTEQSDSDK